MNKKKVVRIELALLAIVTILLAYRAFEGPPAPKGIVVHTRLKADQLSHRAFSVDRPIRISINAVGSFRSESTRDELSAYGWILRRDTREVVWRMDPAAAASNRGTLAVTADSVDLAPGTYDVYFTSYGSGGGSRFGGIQFLNRIFGSDVKWKDDADEWKMIVRHVDSQDLVVNQLSGTSPDQLSPGGQGLLWSTAPMRGRKQAHYLFQTSEPTDVRVYALGEMDRRQMDFGWIEDAVSGVRLWEMKIENTIPAGGWPVNRMFHDTLSLPTGVYRAGYVTDARHSYDDWIGNPPYDPAAWGISLFTDKPEAVAEFDPWKTREPLVEMTRVGDSQRRSAQFVVSRPVHLVAYAVGEMGNDSRYDYGWIQENETQETVWEMTPGRSRPAGGHNNVFEIAFLQLAPATYTVSYVTDDSHSHDSWRHGTPDHPDRWGITIFPMAADFDTSSVRILGYSQESIDDDDRDEMEAPHPPGIPAVAHEIPQPGAMLVELTGVGNEKHVTDTFGLEQPTSLHIRSVGEISLSGRYDYGWIEKEDNGEIVWAMTWQNTQAAGGDDRNRMFDGLVKLDPGRYVVHFKTDFNHAFGDFGEISPQNPHSWGIRITKP